MRLDVPSAASEEIARLFPNARNWESESVAASVKRRRRPLLEETPMKSKETPERITFESTPTARRIGLYHILVIAALSAAAFYIFASRNYPSFLPSLGAFPSINSIQISLPNVPKYNFTKYFSQKTKSKNNKINKLIQSISSLNSVISSRTNFPEKTATNSQIIQHVTSVTTITQITQVPVDVKNEINSLFSEIHSIQQVLKEYKYENIRVLNDNTDLMKSLVEKKFIEVSNQASKDISERLGAFDKILAGFDAKIHELKRADSGITQETLLSFLEEFKTSISKEVDLKIQKALSNTILEELKVQPADGNGREDYALESNGAEVVRSLTSKSYRTYEGWTGKLGMGILRGFGPKMAITNNNMPGKCWAMNGRSGQLGIRFTVAIIPTAYSIDHAPKDLLLATSSLSTAPKRVEFWACLDDKKFEKLDLDDEKVRSASFSKNSVGILMGVNIVESGLSLQTFDLDLNVRRRMENLNLSTRIAVLRIVDNYGNEDYTCLYRFRVHAK